jgi:hypothetical protein
MNQGGAVTGAGGRLRISQAGRPGDASVPKCGVVIHGVLSRSVSRGCGGGSRFYGAFEGLFCKMRRRVVTEVDDGAERSVGIEHWWFLILV